MKFQFESVHKNLNSNVVHQHSLLYDDSKSEFEQGGSKCQFEPIRKNSNFNLVHQPSQPYGSNTKFEQGRRAPEFEPLTENVELEAEARDANIKNTKTRKNKAATKEKLETTKKFSNHIEFIDYIPTHEVIIYSHLFAYGFYVE